MAKTTKLAFLSALLLTAGGFAGCDLDVEIGETETTSESSSSGSVESSSTTEQGDSMSSSQSTTDPGATVGTSTEGSEGSESSGTSGGVMSDSTDSFGTDGKGSNCDPLVQDCPKGEGCYLIEDVYDCAPAGDGGEGDACEFINECQAGLLCIVSPDGNVCTPICDPDQASTCASGECEPLSEGDPVGVCLPGDEPGCDENQVEYQGQCYSTCDPLVQDCAGGETCVPSVDDAFACFPAAGDGEFGAACEFVNTCDVGLFCMNGTVIGSPEASACTPVCDLTEAPSCPGGLECLPFFGGTAPAGSENVGVCGIEA